MKTTWMLIFEPEYFEAAGFTYEAVDLEGFRRGSIE
jgi:hypothetical protein